MNNYKMDFWEKNNFPPELASMCQEYHKQGIDGNTKELLDCLVSHMHDSDSYQGIYKYDASKQDILCWNDTVLNLLFPVEFHTDDWREYAGTIDEILFRSKELLVNVGPKDYETSYRMPSDGRIENNFAFYVQRLHVYSAVLACFDTVTDDEDIADCLKSVLEDTERNFAGMVICGDKEAIFYARANEQLEFTYQGDQHKWDGLAWLAMEYLPLKGEMALVEVYKEYISFLAEKRKEFKMESVEYLYSQSQKRLRTLCDSILQSLDIELELNDTTDSSLLTDEMAYYESIIAEIDELYPPEENYYNDKWETFLESLRSCEQDGIELDDDGLPF